MLHRKWKLKFVPRPPEKLSFQFWPILGYGVGVIRGWYIELDSYYCGECARWGRGKTVIATEIFWELLN